MDQTPDHVTLQTARYFHGFAKIRLNHLSGEFRENKVTKYLKAFTAGQCSRLDPEHYVTALIDSHKLEQALNLSHLERNTLFQVNNPPALSLEDTVVLSCLRGRDFLEAARRLLPPGEKWVVARLYSDGERNAFHVLLSFALWSSAENFGSFRSPSNIKG